jgi:cell shape-determining protein MreD
VTLITPEGAVFWIYLAAYFNMGGITALVLGLIARFTSRPFDTPRRFRVFLGLLAIVALVGLIASGLSFNLTSKAGAFASFRASSLIWPFVISMVIFVWASGFPLSRIFPRRS